MLKLPFLESGSHGCCILLNSAATKHASLYWVPVSSRVLLEVMQDACNEIDQAIAPKPSFQPSRAWQPSRVKELPVRAEAIASRARQSLLLRSRRLEQLGALQATGSCSNSEQQHSQQRPRQSRTGRHCDHSHYKYHVPITNGT